MISFASVNLVSVLISTVAAIALGMAWYSPKGLFGAQWMQLTGIKEPDPKTAKSSMISGFGMTLFSVYVIALILNIVNPATLKDALIFAGLLWLGVVLFCEGNYVIWEQRPAKLIKINALYILAYLLLVVGILTYLG